MYLPSLTDEELLRYADSQIDSLTTTDLERELIKRFGALIDESTENNPILYTLEAHGVEIKDLEDISEAIIGSYQNSAELLTMLGEEGIDTPSELKALIAAAEATTEETA